MDKQQAAYDLIDSELKYWHAEFTDEHSEANLYGLCMVDAVYFIHKKLNEKNL